MRKLPARKRPQIGHVVPNGRRRKCVMVQINLKTIEDQLELGAWIGRVTIYSIGVAGYWFSIAGGNSVSRQIQPQITAPLAAGSGIYANYNCCPNAAEGRHLYAIIICNSAPVSRFERIVGLLAPAIDTIKSV